MSEPAPAARPILCIGFTPALQHTLEFDALATGEVNRARAGAVSAAGKAVNVARILSCLGSPAIVTGFLGGGTGEQVADLVHRQGIMCEWVTTRQPTRQCHTLLDSRSGQVTELVEEAALPEPDEWAALEERLQQLMPRAGLVIVTGALPLNASPDIYGRVVNWAAAARVDCLVDAQKESLRAALTGRPLLAKLNRRELEVTLGQKKDAVRDPVSALGEVRKWGAGWLLMTQGPEAAWLVGEPASYRLFPPPIRALNPIGSGDAVTAGIAHALQTGQAMPDAVRFGIACGTAAALKRLPGEVDPDAVADLLPHVRTERIQVTAI